MFKTCILLVYVETARSSSPSTLSFTIATGGTWRIKVSQIECSNLSRAPTDCDQFFTGNSGQFSSYNFGNVQLQSTDNTACIRREEGNVLLFVIICLICGFNLCYL